MNRSIFPVLWGIILLAISSGLGCTKSGPSVAPEVLAKHRAALVLAEEPEGAQTVLEVRETLLGGEPETAEHADHDHAAHDEEPAHAEDHAHENGDHDHDHAHADHDHADHKHAHAEEVKPAGPIDVLMVGSVGGLANPWEETQPHYPFAAQQAVFFLADMGEVAELDAHGHTHAPGEECAFCAAHAAEASAMLAMVRFTDENGKVLPIEASDLFDLKEKDTVVIRGTARIIDGGMMIVDATGLYVRR